MINKQLLEPSRILIVGGSNNIHKPGGKIIKNLRDARFNGELFVVNPREDEVQGLKSFRELRLAPAVDLAILSIPATACLEVVTFLARERGVKAFIIISAGFSEEGKEGAELERKIVEVVESTGGCLVGPNCIGIVNANYAGVFTTPIPRLNSAGCEFISSSGATAVFIMESAIPKGLSFSAVYTVGNCAQLGVEEFLEYLDETFDPEKSSRVKLLYIESIRNPDKLLKHTSSLIRKGCRIAAIKAGGSAAGSRAALSHTGALASSDLAVEALFRKAGIVRCSGREELTTVASVMLHPELKGKNVAIITHAGGPAVMLTDALSQGGLDIPHLGEEENRALLALLNPGAAAGNPIDLLATGTAEQLGQVIDFCDKKCENIDAIMVIFGSTGLSAVFDAYEVLHHKMLTSAKPIFPILPSVLTARQEVEFFLSRGHINFPDEVQLGKAVSLVHVTPKPAEERILLDGVNVPEIRRIVDKAKNGFLPPEEVNKILQAASIPVVRSGIATTAKQAVSLAEEIGFPLVMKVVGPVHKTETGGVVLNINTEKHLTADFARLKKIPGAAAVQIQPMISGIELFIGAKYEPTFGHVMLCGLGGIFVEVLKDVSSGLAPLTFNEAYSMIRSLKSYKIIKGARGKEGVNEKKFAEIIVRLSSLLRFAVEIKELDLNPLIGRGDSIQVVDARILIEK
jgi:acetyltransferase